MANNPTERTETPTPQYQPCFIDRATPPLGEGGSSMSDETIQSCMQVNEAASAATLQDGIYERLDKMEGVLVALMADDNDSLSFRVLRNALWCLETQLDEVRDLNRLQWKKLRAEKVKEG